MPLRQAISEADHILGDPGAALELVEYGDYECPYCGKAFPFVKEIQNKFETGLKFVFRHFPLSKIHPHAKSAAIAAEAAALQGKFWEMHDTLFENQRRLTSVAIIEYTQQLDLDVTKFAQDIRLPELNEKIDAQFYSGMRSGVNATPTFFINGEKYEGSIEELLQFISNKQI